MKYLNLTAVVFMTPLAYSASVTQNFVTTDQNWFSDHTSGGTGSGPYGLSSAHSSYISTTTAPQTYDERSLTFTGLSGTVVDEIFIVTDLAVASGTPKYDDGFAVDLNADNVIDYVFTQNDALNTPGVTGFSGSASYNPWSDATPLIFEITITATGTNIDAFWRGGEISFAGSGKTGFNNASSLTLADLGFNSDGSVPSDNFTTQGIRLGSINSEGGAVNHPSDFNLDGVRLVDDMGNVMNFDPDGDGLPASIPEPASSVLLGLGFLAFAARRSR